MAITDNIKASWNLDESSGDAIDNSGNGKTGVNTNVTFGDAPTYGKINKGAIFNGSAKLLTTGPISTVIDNFTFLCWVYISGTSLKGCFFSNGSSASGNTWGYAIGIGNTDFSNNGNNIILVTLNVACIPTTKAIGTGWHQVGMIRDAGNWYAVLDGVRYSASSTSTPTAPNGHSVIGATGQAESYNSYFTGYMDIPTFWERVLTTQELLDTYNSGAGMQFYTQITANTTNFFNFI